VGTIEVIKTENQIKNKKYKNQIKTITKQNQINNNKTRKNITKRGPGKYKEKIVPIFSANGAGCLSKVQSIVDNVTHIGVGIITLQETHFKVKGKMNSKLKDFQIFEAIRKRMKGGTLIGAHKSLDPVLIEEYSEDFELLVVEVKLGSKDVRIISGYGPQENWKLEDRMPFFRALEEEIVKAKLNNKVIFIQMDANSKLGPDIIEGDPHIQSANGKILAEIVERNALIVMNSVKNKCKGKITRRRITRNVKEESIIDFVIGCEEMAEMIEHVNIDEEKTFVLTKYRKTKHGVKVIESDHNSIITYVKAGWNKKINIKRIEMYHLKDKEGLNKFNEMTSHDKFLSSVFDDENKSINVQTKHFLKRFEYCLSKCFKKIRIRNNKRNNEIEDLFNKRRILRNKTDEKSAENLRKVEEQIADKCAEDNYKTIKEVCGGLTPEEGGLNAGKLWKLKRQLKGIVNDPPTAMIDSKGNLVTTSGAIENLTIKMYTDRLKTLKIKDELEVHMMQREDLCDQRLKEAHEHKTPEWSMEDLVIVLKQLKNNKSRDPLGFANELFKPENAGYDLNNAVLKMMNIIKQQQIFPEPLGYCNITSIYKNKGSRKEFDNYRGIFRVTILRSILDKLIYNDEYPIIDENISDSNVGARKGRNIRDNIFVINAILNEVRRRKLKGIDIQILDVKKCFDKLWAKECINDIFDNGLQNDKLSLLYKTNINAKVAIKTPAGITRRIVISDVIMQGTVWGSLLCTSTMDNLGKIAYSMPDDLYKYKGVPIPPLGMVDDIICVSKLDKTLIMNKTINSFIEHKKLELSDDKCSRIHIGLEHTKCPALNVHNNMMKDSGKEKYLGDIIDSTGKIQATINDRKARGSGIIAEIMSIISEIPFGKYKFEVAMKLRQAMFLNGILYNSEAWHGVTRKQIKILESVDESLLRSILKAHSKTPKELLYLETGAVPIRYIVAQRRILYLRHIVNRVDGELLKTVFMAQKDNPTQGDFVTLVEKDLNTLGISYEEATSNKLSKNELKTRLKVCATNVALKQLKIDQLSHNKVKHIVYTNLQMQHYLINENLTSAEIQTLFAFRSSCTRGIKMNFKNMYKKCLLCPLKCNMFQKDTQEHLLECPKLNDCVNTNVNIIDIFSENMQQERVAKLLAKLLRKRNKILEEMLEQNSSLPGAILDQSTLSGATTVHNV
jgi:hypothetical protein